MDQQGVERMWDSLRGYVNLASGLTEVTARKAVETATTLLTSGVDEIPDAVTESVTGVAEDMARMTTAQRDALTSLVRTEVDRAVGRLGFVREDELAALRRRVTRLEEQVVAVGVVPAAATLGVGAANAVSQPPVSAAGVKSPVASKTPVKTAAVKKTAVKKTAVKKTAVKSSTSGPVAPSAVTADDGPSAQAPAKKAAVKRPVNKKSAVKATPSAAKRPATKASDAASATRRSGDDSGAIRRPSAGSRTLASGR
jgi:polyhydroxyalkanoate synthesis regulator phasin